MTKELTEKQRSLYEFFLRHPHPPWMENPGPYFPGEGEEE